MISILYYLTCFAGYLRRTIWMKLVAIAIVIPGWIATEISGDGTALMFLLMFFAIPMFFIDNKNIETDEEL